MKPNQHPHPVQAAEPSGRTFREYRVPRGAHRLYARDHPGTEPAIVFMHGFPATCTCTTGWCASSPGAGW